MYEGLNVLKVLPNDELYELLEKVTSGKDKDNEARNKIIYHNMGLVTKRVWTRFVNFPYDKKDLVSVGLIGLIECIDKFDMNKKCEFSTFATNCIDNKILNFIKWERKHVLCFGNNVSVFVTSSGREISIDDYLEDVDTNLVCDYEDLEVYKRIREILEELPLVKREVIKMWFGFDYERTYTQVEISEKMGIPRSSLCRLINKTVREIEIKLRSENLVEGKSILDGCPLVKKKSKVKKA